MTEFQLGSISTGTLRTEDLLFDFALALREFEDKWNSEHEALYDQAKQHMAQAPSESELNQTVSNLQDALQEYCPPFVYFGALEGDGADFGFWPDRETIQEIVNIAECDASQGISCPDDGVIVQVSDHGNVTVMDMERNVLWSVV